jgi:hypothetical protein
MGRTMQDSVSGREGICYTKLRSTFGAHRASYSIGNRRSSPGGRVRVDGPVILNCHLHLC